MAQVTHQEVRVVIADPSDLRCFYCLANIDPNDDAQKIDRKKYAHTACAWNINEDFIVTLDATLDESERAKNTLTFTAY